MVARTVVLLCSLSVAGFASDVSAMVTGVEPRTGGPGTVLTLTGVGLDGTRIQEVYLSDLQFNLMVKVLEQTGERMKVRIPPFARPGRYQILFLVQLKGEPVLLEQSAYVQIQPGEAAFAATPTPTPAPAPVAAAIEPKVEAPAAPAAVKPAPVEVAKVVPQTAPPQPGAEAPAVPKAAPTEVAEARPVPPTGPSVPVAQEPELSSSTSPLATPVEIVTRTPLVYPEMAKQMRLSGAVRMQVMVDSNGKVRSVQVLEGHPILAAAASDAVKKWNYRAATLRGKPVTSATVLKVEFTGR